MTSNNRGRNTIGGIIFLVLAAMALFGGFSIFDDLPLWRMALTVILLFWLGDGLRRRDWGSILFPIAIVAVIWINYFDFKVSAWSLIMAALFGTIGLGFIFGNSRKSMYEGAIEYNSEDGVDGPVGSATTDNAFTFSTSFASSVKYIKSDDFKHARINASFGESKIYFNDAIIQSGEATVDVDVKFGQIELYVPRDWFVTNNARVMFGDITEKNRSMTSGTPKINIIGNVAFGSVIVFYI